MQHGEAQLREKYKDKTIGVLMGGMSSERDISLKTGAAVQNALQKKGYRTRSLDVTPQVMEHVRDQGIDVAFLALHGSFGEDGTIQGMLELMGIPYTGSGVLASALAINKVASKKIFSFHGLPTPAFEVLHAEGQDAEGLAGTIRLPLPVVVKPAEGGSTIGISIVREPRELGPALAAAARYDREILIEEFIAGRELTVGILEGEALPLVEIKPASGFYDYTAKYNSGGTTRYIVGPSIPGTAATAIQRLALAAFHAFGCSGAPRVDFILRDDNSPFILEINTIPGMTETSLLPKAAQHAGIDFEILVERILWSARLHKRAPGGTPSGA